MPGFQAASPSNVPGSVAARSAVPQGQFLPVNDNGEIIGVVIINQKDGDTSIVVLKSSDIAHAATSVEAANVFGALKKANAGFGGVEVRGFSEDEVAFRVAAYYTNDDTGKLTTSHGAIDLDALKSSGTGTTSPGADANLAVIRAAGTTRFIFDNEGSAHADVEFVAFDDYDDLALLDAYADPVREEFGSFMQENREILQREGVVNFYDEGPRAMLNTTRMQMLLIGAVRQMGKRLQQYEQALIGLGADPELLGA